MNPVGLILNVVYAVSLTYMYFINMKLIYEQQKNVIVMLHYISVDKKGECNVYREGLGTRRVAVISIGRVHRQSLRITRMTDAYRGSLKIIR